MSEPRLSADEIRRAIYKLEMDNPSDKREEQVILLREIAAQLAEINHRLSLNSSSFRVYTRS